MTDNMKLASPSMMLILYNQQWAPAPYLPTSVHQCERHWILKHDKSVISYWIVAIG
jgi:hypothetical protein